MGMLIEDRSCEACYGDGKSSDGSRCWNCRGTGRRLTELGRELVQLLDDYFVIPRKSALSEDGR